LVREALAEHNVDANLLVISDGDCAIQFIDDLDAWALDCPELVILDLNLPKRSGREVLQHICNTWKCQGVTVVVLSSSDASEEKADALSLGAHHYIRKPLLLNQFMELGATFKQLLAASRAKGS